MGATKSRRDARDPRFLVQGLDRILKARGLQELVRGALSVPALKRLLRDAMPKSAAGEMPPEVFSSLAASIAAESQEFAEALAAHLDDRLGWDREPADMDGWWEATRQRPLEALWMAGLSSSKAVRKEFPHIVRHCLDNHRAGAPPPTWQFVDALLDLQAESEHRVRDAERAADEAERRQTADRERLEEQREELKRQRRELAELRTHQAAERKSGPLPAAPLPPEAARFNELERRLRKAEKENEHLRRQLERRAEAEQEEDATPEAGAETAASVAAAAAEEASIASDTNPRRRVLRHMLRKLVSKGKIGASHTHEDNVFRGVADHEKGIAKRAMDLLYREGFLLPKPTATDPHVSLAPERVADVKAIVAGRIESPRLQRFLDE